MQFLPGHRYTPGTSLWCEQAAAVQLQCEQSHSWLQSPRPSADGTSKRQHSQHEFDRVSFTICLYAFCLFSPAPLSVCSLSLMDEDEQWTAMKRRRTSDGKSVPSANNLIPIQINFTHAVPRARCLSEVSTVESLSVVTWSSRDRSDNASVGSARSDNSKAGSSESLDCAADLDMWAAAVRRKRPSVT